jgi:chaperone required for assembly of F1-ATPase
LTALHELVALSGSLVLGLAAFEGALDAEAAWTASRIDEDWQIEQWGEDAEAAEAAALKRADFAQAARLAAMLRDGTG